MFDELLAVAMGSVLASVRGRDPGPVGRMNRAYKKSYEEANMSGDWRDALLIARLRNLTVPGLHSETALTH